MGIVSKTISGVSVSWAGEHRDKDGNLIVRMASVGQPQPLRCIRPSCIIQYGVDTLTYALVALYHERRVQYAEANRRKVILERYRTGEPSPKNLWQALYALTKLKCPLCRKVNTPAKLEKALKFQ